MRYWFQNLKKDDREKRLFHFRGSIGSDSRTWLRYSLVSGRACKFQYDHGESCDSDASSQLAVGLLFFTIYLTFYLPRRFYFQRKCVATWEGNREFYLVDGRRYGFYFYNWAFVWHWHAKANESSSREPWWMSQYIHLDDLVLGKPESIKDELISIEDVKFSLGGKEFLMNSIQWVRYRRFRRFIPYSLYHRTSLSVDMKIDKPPMRSGKGENSWDCGDDGAFGIHCQWPHESPTYLNREACAELAVGMYVDSVMKDVRRYGGTDSERGVTKAAEYKFIGREPYQGPLAQELA